MKSHLKTELIQGDCIQEMHKIPDKSIDLILTDLPYGMTRCKWDQTIPFEPLWREYRRIIKGNGAILLFSIQPFTTDLIQSNRKMFRYEIIWEKTQKLGFLNANRMPLKAHENILVFYEKLPVYNPQKTSATKSKGRVRKKKADRCVLYGHVEAQDYVDSGQRYPTDVIRFSNWNGALFGKTDKATKHPTQKPVPLLEYLIRTYTNVNDTVLDSCMGSGSTGIAALNTGRNFIGIELDPQYFEIAKKRIEEDRQ